MSTEMNGIHEVPAVAAPSAKRIRPLYWSLRRELWENRSLYLAPLTVAGILLFIFFVRLFTLPARMRVAMEADLPKQYSLVTGSYDMTAGMIMMAGVLAGIFYCLDALHGERRDRSILFWKSLPVSDRTTVLSKFLTATVVLPLIVWIIACAAQLIMVVLSTTILQATPGAVATLWSNVRLFQRLLAGAWGLFAMALWHAPIYAWLLLVSGWAKRAAFLWAALPAFIVSMAESTAGKPALVRYRLAGWFSEAFVAAKPRDGVALGPLASMRVLNYLSTPGLWIGLLFAAALLAATIRMRRDREPI